MSKYSSLRRYFEDEDDGTRIYDDEMHLLCNKCGAIMQYEYDPEEDIDYFRCPACDHLELDSYNDGEDDVADSDYELYWPEEDDEDDIY